MKTLNKSSHKLLTENLWEHLNDTTTAKVAINSDTGNLTIDGLTGDEPVLASGLLQYFRNHNAPTRILDYNAGQATLTLHGGGSERSGFRFPWSACKGGAYEWQIHLNPSVSFDIAAYSGGGNVRLDLAAMSVTNLSAETGGGNMDVVLPDHAVDLCSDVKAGGGNVTVEIGSGATGSHIVNARSGAGNVIVTVPGGMGARIKAASGLGKVIIDPRFAKINGNTYQSPGYDSASVKVEITAQSGVGNVIVNSLPAAF